MRHYRLTILGLTAVALSIFAAPFTTHAEENEPPPTPDEEQPEVLTSGPVHEAFAEPVAIQAQAAVVAPTPPPANIEEVPPADRPAGNYAWVPGYWAWDTDRSGYIWVSACWRLAPPGTYWVPGYWGQTANGYEWIAGFWAPVGSTDIEYLPEPPVVEDVQPVGLAPAADFMWVPGCYYYREGQFTHRHGYWLKSYPNWVWIPSHYNWTPRGYVFCPGHWDYELANRGVLFAPVYFPSFYHHRVGYRYSPTIVVDIGCLSINLFAYPRYHHYYFGDYYDAIYIGRGIRPCYGGHHRSWYDPIYECERARSVTININFESDRRHFYEERRDNRDLRPTRTFRELEERRDKLPETQRRNIEVARPLDVVVASRAKPSTTSKTAGKIDTTTTTPIKFERMTDDARTRIATQAVESRKFRDQRNDWEEKPDRKPGTITTAPAPASGGDRRNPGVIQAPGSDHRNPPAISTPESRDPAVGQPHQGSDVAPKPKAIPPSSRNTAPEASPEPRIKTAPAPAPSPEPRIKSAPAPEPRKSTIPLPETRQPVAAPPARSAAPAPSAGADADEPIVPPRNVRAIAPERVKVSPPPSAPSPRSDSRGGSDSHGPNRDSGSSRDSGHDSSGKGDSKGR